MPIFPDFLPQDVQLLTETTSVSFAKKIQRKPIAVTIGNRTFTVDTAFVSDYGDDFRSVVDPREADSAKTPILLLHGFDSSMFEFRRLMPKLATSHSTFAVDLLGFGFTDRSGFEQITPEMIKGQLYSFWKEYIGKPVILVGASMGGAAAIDFTLSHPDAVSQLVLLDSAGFAKAPVFAKFMAPPLSYWATNFLSSPRVRHQVNLRAYFDPSFVTKDAECCGALHLQMPDWHLALAAFTRSGGYGFLSDRISEIAVPTKIIWGRQDRILGTKDAVKFEQTVVGSRLYWMENCGHVPHLEKAEETAQIILS